MADKSPQLQTHKFAAECRVRWRDYPVRIIGPMSKCHEAPTLLVRSMTGGFVTANCTECGEPQSINMNEFEAAHMTTWISCPVCRRRMEIGKLAEIREGRKRAGNYGYSCGNCNICFLAGEILPDWRDI